MKKIFFAFLLIVVSCGQKKNHITISLEPIEFDVSTMGISSDLPFPFNVRGDSVVIFNYFDNSFYTLNLKTGSSDLLMSFQDDDRIDLSGLVSFLFKSDKELFVFESNSILLISNQEIIKYPLNRFTVSGEKNFNLDDFKIVNNMNFGNYLPDFNPTDRGLYLILEERKFGLESVIVKFLLDAPEKLVFLHELDADEIKNQKIFMEKSNYSIYNQTIPYLSQFKSKLILSYPFKNRFDYMDLETMKMNEIGITSSLFKNMKTEQILVKEDIPEFMAMIKAWNNDITYGPMLVTKDGLYYFRLIKGESKALKPLDGDIFIQLFDVEMLHLGDFKLENEFRDLTLEYFSSIEGIFVKRISDKENVLKYFKMTIQEE